MANSIDYYRRLIGSEGYNNEKEYKLSQFVSNYNKNLKNYVSKYDIMINSNRADEAHVNLDKSNKIRILVGLHKPINKTDLLPYRMTEVLLPMDSAKTGDYITVFDKKRNKEINYLILAHTGHRDGYDVGYMAQCNLNFLRYYSKVDNKVKELPCLSINTTFYSLGIEENPVNPLVIPKGKMNVLISDGNGTQDIQRDVRLVIDKAPWKITNTNRLKGYLDIVCEEDVFNQYDDSKNQIADRWKYEKKYSYSIVSIPETTKMKVNDIQIIKTEVYLNSTIVNNPAITYVSDNTTVATIDSIGMVKAISVGICNIIVSFIGLDNQTYTKTIPIVVDNSMVNNFNYKIVSDNTKEPYVIRKLSTITFTPKKYDDNMELETKWEFDNNYNNLDGYYISEIEKTNKYVKIKNNKVDTSSPLKIITIKYRESGQSNWDEQIIQLKGFSG